MASGIFNADAIKSAIQDALNKDVTIPDGHRAAITTFINNDKVEVALGYKINNHWTVDLIGQHDWVGDNNLGVISKLTW